MLNKSRGRIILFGEHSDWMVKYTTKNENVPDTIIGLASSTNIGMSYRAVETKGSAVTFESEGISGVRRVYFSNKDTRSKTNFTDTTQRLLDTAVSVAYSYISDKKKSTNFEDDESCKGVDIIVIDQDLPIKRGLASSTCMIRAIIYELIRVNGLLNTTNNADICRLMQKVEEIVNETNAESDIIINNAPGLSLINHSIANKLVSNDSYLRTMYNKVEGNGDKLIYNEGLNELVLIDIGPKSANTDYVVKALSAPFTDSNIPEQCAKDVANLFGETTTDYSTSAAGIISNYANLHMVYRDLGLLMWEFQKQYTSVIDHNDQYLPSIIGDHRANKIIKILMDARLIYGGKVIGSHGDSIILASTEHTADIINNRLKADVRLRQKRELNDVKIINI